MAGISIIIETKWLWWSDSVGQAVWTFEASLLYNTMPFKARANARNIVGPNMLRAFAHHVVCCCDLLEVVGWSLKLVKLQSQQVSTFLLFRGHRSVVQQCCVRLHSTSNNVAPAHAHYMPRIHTNTCEQEINMASEMENVPESFVFSSKDPTCCDLLRAFAHIG